MQELIVGLKKQFKIFSSHIQKSDYTYFYSDPEEAVSLITHLRDIKGFVHLSFFTAVDFIEDGIFVLNYMLHNYETSKDIGVKVKIPRDNPTMQSIHHLWEQAGTYQRELFEMYGISFPGSPRLTEPFALEGWAEIPPMRRDFDTKEYSEKTFYPRPGRESTDPYEYMKENLKKNSEKEGGIS